jgi:dipeptidyl-peptidase-3
MQFKTFFSMCTAMSILTACTGPSTTEPTASSDSTETASFEYVNERFGDIRLLRYQVPGFDQLTPQQRLLVYYLSQAALSGRDIIYDQNYKHNLSIRKAIESVVANYKGERSGEEWDQFMVYAKRVWFSNGIHHHYSTVKFTPSCSRGYFDQLLADVNATLNKEVVDIMFDTITDMKRVNKDASVDIIAASANNFYADGITEAEVDAYYKSVIPADEKNPVSWGLNSQMVRNADGTLKEDVYKIGGKYSAAIEKIVGNLQSALPYTESDAQRKGLELLIEYYKTGSLKVWDDHNIAWVQATGDVVDYINGFIEVYGDAKGYRGTYESVVQIKDFDASERMKTVEQNVQWFEDNSPILAQHKKEKVVGVTYKVISAAMEAGDAAPSTPIGINLPNANWIRAQHGSKSVSLGNITEAYDNAGSGPITEEFCYTPEEADRAKKYGSLAGKLHTALHEVVGHASGQLEPGVGTPKETLKNYSSTLEEARADLVALYYIMDNKLVEMGLMDNIEVGKTEYDGYIRNGLLTQLRRIEPGDNIEEDHMRNRQMIAAWVYENGKPDNVIERVEREGKTYFVINDYDKLRSLFGDLLREVQRIKSQGDFEAGKNMVETYGVKVDAALHAQVLSRSEKLDIPPYAGFIQPRIIPLYNEQGDLIDAGIEYPESFVGQMMEYGEKFSTL